MTDRRRLGVDTNVLVYAHIPAMPDHRAVRGFVQSRLEEAKSALIVTPLVLHELVHVITDARRFDPPVAMGEALALANSFLHRSNVECVAVDEDSIALAFKLLDRHALGRRRVADTLLAATLMRHHVTDLITCNPCDFELFDALTIIDPRAS